MKISITPKGLEQVFNIDHPVVDGGQRGGQRAEKREAYVLSRKLSAVLR